MDYYQASKFIPLIHTRFEEKWSDAFTKVNTRNANDYDNANGSMYTYYITIINALNNIPETPKYHRNYDDMKNSYSFVKDMYNDFKSTKDICGWLMEFVPIK